MVKITHAMLEYKGKMFLKNTKKCSVVVTDYRKVTLHENPDVFGINASAKTYMIECKVSKADFRNDHKKRHRKNINKGLGNYRYMMCPKDLISKRDMLPHYKGWGLLYFDGRSVTQIKRPTVFKLTEPVENLNILLQIIRSVYHGWDTEKIFVRKVVNKKYKEKKQKALLNK